MKTKWTVEGSEGSFMLRNNAGALTAVVYKRAHADMLAASAEMLGILKEIQAIPANEPGRIVCLMQRINDAVRDAEGQT